MADVERVLKAELAQVRERLAGWEDLKEEERRLEGAIAAYRGERMPSGSRTPGKPSRGRRSSLDDSEIIHAIHVFGGPAPASEIREQLGDISGNTLSVRLKKLVDEGVLKREGERRASRYTVVS